MGWDEGDGGSVTWDIKGEVYIVIFNTRGVFVNQVWELILIKG